MHFSDPAFWRAGAISTIVVMSVVLAMLTIDSLAVISPGGMNVPLYTVINQHIDYKFDAKRGNDVPVIGGAEPLFGKSLDAAAALALIDRGKMVIQSRACIDCHTFFGNGAHYGRANARRGHGEVPDGSGKIPHLDAHDAEPGDYPAGGRSHRRLS